MNFLTLGLVKALVRVQIKKTKKAGSWKKNSVVPSNIVKVKIDDDREADRRYEDEKILRSSTDEETAPSEEELLTSAGAASPRGLLLDLTRVTWLDSEGCSLVTWLADQCGLAGLVLPLHLEEVVERWEGFSRIKCLVYPTIADAVQLAVDTPRIF